MYKIHFFVLFCGVIWWSFSFKGMFRKPRKYLKYFSFIKWFSLTSILNILNCILNILYTYIYKFYTQYSKLYKLQQMKFYFIYLIIQFFGMGGKYTGLFSNINFDLIYIKTSTFNVHVSKVIIYKWIEIWSDLIQRSEFHEISKYFFVIQSR